MVDKTLVEQGIPVRLLRKNLAKAQSLAKSQPTKEKSKQVYLNSLAVYAVNNYLRILGISTDLEASNSQNPIICMTEDIADLKVSGKGFLECRAIEADATSCYIPEEVRFDRIGYIAVQINIQTNQAILLGFSATAATSWLNLNRLQNLTDLPRYLNQSQPLVNLSQWLENNIFEADWLSLELVLGSQPRLAFRDELVERCKQIKFEENCTLVFILRLQKQQKEIDILVEFQPENQTFLPPNLTVAVLDSKGEKVMEARSKLENRKIQFQFSGQKGDLFSIQFFKDEIDIKEDFII